MQISSAQLSSVQLLYVQSAVAIFKVQLLSMMLQAYLVILVWILLIIIFFLRSLVILKSSGQFIGNVVLLDPPRSALTAAGRRQGLTNGGNLLAHLRKRLGSPPILVQGKRSIESLCMNVACIATVSMSSCVGMLGIASMHVHKSSTAK